MNNAQLEAFRQIAAEMQSGPTDWQWIGVHMSQRHFGITEAKAKYYAERFGGVAQQMPLQLGTRMIEISPPVPYKGPRGLS